MLVPLGQAFDNRLEPGCPVHPAGEEVRTVLVWVLPAVQAASVGVHAVYVQLVHTGALQVFEQIYMLGGGSGEAGSKFGPADSGMTIVCYIYRKGFEDFQMGEASAVAYLLFAVIFILTWVNWKILRRQET